MAESSLLLGYADFQKEVGIFLGYGFDTTRWTAEQTAEVDRIIQSGLRQFYFPGDYDWSFLKPAASLTTAALTKDYTLPDSFGGLIDDKLTFDSADCGYASIPVVGEARIRELRQRNQSGKPEYAAVRPKASDGTTGQRFEIMFWPTPDAVYTLGYRYEVLADKLSALKPYPLGGARHSETILESCLAVAEGRPDDTLGIHNQRFASLLLGSINFDKRIGTPGFMGYNGDGSSRPSGSRNRFLNVTVNGVVIE